MIPAFALHFESHLLLALALAAGLAAALTAWRRRMKLPTVSLTLIGLGMIALILAAGGLTWDRPKAGEVAVMVDLSASTRGARYRDRAALDRRIAQLLGRTPYRLIFFAGNSGTGGPPVSSRATGGLPASADDTGRQAARGTTGAFSPSPGAPGEGRGEGFADLPGDRTIFAPPPTAAVLLFSDGRFGLPTAAPPTYVALDPALEQTEDSAIERLEMRGAEVAARVRNQSPQPRDAVVADQRKEIGQGSLVITRRANPQQQVSAAVRGQDLWPENDALSLRIPPPIASERWWVGDDAPAGWRAMTPAQLPVEPEPYLGASIIILSNTPANALSGTQQQRIEQYVRELGGGLAILGGERAFAAGGYSGSRIETISPVSSTPPGPAVHWVLLADSSGSMADPAAGTTRWEMVRRAATGLLGHLPPEDAITIGSFAQNLRWWSKGRSARETSMLPLPPPDVRPHGPTNLESALQSIIAGADTSMRKELLILSDADADIQDADALAAGLAQRKIRLHLLDTYGKGRGLAPLSELARRSGGQVVRELDPGKWVTAARKLAGQAADDQLQRDAATVRFAAELAGLAARQVPLWNRVWLKERASTLAETSLDSERMPLAAQWQQGLGRVAAVAFRPTPAEAEAIARLVEQRPVDPRLRITWDAGSRLRVTIDAVDAGAYLNGLKLELELAEEGGPSRRMAIPQSGPGQYELATDNPRRPAIATVWHAGRPVARTAIAGRYPLEFDAIGTDRDTLARLAALTGGRVIEPGSTSPIDFDWPRRSSPLVHWLAMTGFFLIGGGLLWWRLR